MKDKEKFIFFLDIDGTVYADGIVCEKNRKAIADVRKNGHLVFINTGRSPGIIPHEVRPLEVDGWVTALGSNIIINSKYIYSQALDKNELIEIFDRMTRQKRKVLYEGNDCVIINRYYDPCGYDAVRVDSMEEYIDRFSDRVIPKIFIPEVISKEEADAYSEKYTFFQHPTYVEISPKGDNKATGMQKVLDYYEPEKFTTVAMGDSLNDIQMLNYADIAVAMGDSHPDILPMCDIITCDARDGGVAQAMRQITGIKEQ